MPGTTIRPGDVVLDRARNVPLQVVDVDHRTAQEHRHIDVGDPLHWEWGVTPEDRVFECVFLPTGGADETVSTPSKTYAYPASRLLRYPVEAGLGDDARRVHTQILVEFLAAMLRGCADADATETDRHVRQAAIVADQFVDTEVPTEVLIEEAADLANAATFGGEADV